MYTVYLVVGLLVSCGSNTPSGNSPALDDSGCTDDGVRYVDGDGDGFGDDATQTGSCEAPEGSIERGGDCNDQSPLVNPDASESCNGVDDNCNGDTDEGVQLTFFRDVDGDGYGDDMAVISACEPPDGFVARGGDCRDDDPAFHPGALEDSCTDPNDYNCDGSVGYTDADGDGWPACVDCDDLDAERSPDAVEICDSIDNDCDGAIDGSKSIDALTWYGDADGDGYGVDGDKVKACEAPAGFVKTGGDCDDTDTAYHPGAAEADCTDPNDYNCDGSVGYADDDADGWPACEDCDDKDAASYPGGSEVCDEADNDCDGLIDDDDDSVDPKVGGKAYYTDSDGDGYGKKGTGAYACKQPTGRSRSFKDCDDTDAKIHPGAKEIWYDGVDQNCDSASDYDADADGYDSSDYESSSTSTDCDDSDAAINPDADEICNDGADNDCDGEATACSLDLARADAVMVGENAGDRAGFSVSGAGDVDGDGLDDLIVGAYSNDAGGSSAGAAYLVLGPTKGGTIDLSAAKAKLVGEAADDYAGRSVSGVGDVDGDGHADLLVGADGNDEGAPDAGAAYLVLGPINGTISLSDADAMLLGEAWSDAAGAWVSGAGDVDGDGHGDLFVGAYENDEGGTSVGAAYLVLGPTTGGEIALSSAQAKFIGEGDYDFAGSVVSSAGDANGDGFFDLLVGAYGSDANGSRSGAAFMIFGPVSGSVDLSAADARLLGEKESDYAGISVASAGDMDGDGNDDLLVGAMYDDKGGKNAGAAYLILGPVSGTHKLSAADAKLVGESANDAAASALAGAGDVDGDGHPDLLVSAMCADAGGVDAGGAYVVFGPVSGTFDLSSADAVFVGETAGDNAGVSVNFAGDVDGDGNSDILVGAASNDQGGTEAGAAYLILGLGF